MTQLRTELVVLPDELADRQRGIDEILDAANEIQEEINATRGNLDKKVTLGKQAIALLDKKAEDVYFGDEVQIEGSYSIEHRVIDKQRLIYEPVDERGVRVGNSLGFTVQFLKIRDKEADDDGIVTQICHLLEYDMGPTQLSYIRIPEARGSIVAPIDESVLGCTAIESFVEIELARRRVTGLRHDTHWTHDIDSFLCEPGGPNLRSLGGKLVRMAAVRQNRISDYLTYINTKLGSYSSLVEVMTQEFAFSEPDEKPSWVKKDYIVTGLNEGIHFIDISQSYEKYPAKPVVYGEGAPVLNLRARFEGEKHERILYVPLKAIHCAVFK